MKIKQKIESILEDTGHGNTRAAKMDLNDILKHVSFSMWLHPVHLIDRTIPDYYQLSMTQASTSHDDLMLMRRS
jgi:hypothetical protein